MQKIRQLYRQLVPLFIRQAIWNIISSYNYILSDKAPHNPIFTGEYDDYWDRRSEREGGLGLSYGDLVKLVGQYLPHNARVLDFGCGDGELLSVLQENFILTRALGLDISDKAVAFARQHGVEAEQFILHDQHDLVQFGEFDVAIATEVLEHIIQAELVLVALANIAEQIIISIPNTGYYKYRLRLLLGRFPRQWREHPAEHVRFWTLRDFAQTMQWLGLKIEAMHGFGEVAIGGKFPGLFSSNLLFVLKKSL